jgi:hypothetical protein
VGVATDTNRAAAKQQQIRKLVWPARHFKTMYLENIQVTPIEREVFNAETALGK